MPYSRHSIPRLRFAFFSALRSSVPISCHSRKSVPWRRFARSPIFARLSDLDPIFHLLRSHMSAGAVSTKRKLPGSSSRPTRSAPHLHNFAHAAAAASSDSVPDASEEIFKPVEGIAAMSSGNELDPLSYRDRSLGDTGAALCTSSAPRFNATPSQSLI